MGTWAPVTAISSLSTSGRLHIRARVSSAPAWRRAFHGHQGARSRIRTWKSEDRAHARADEHTLTSGSSRTATGWRQSVRGARGGRGRPRKRRRSSDCAARDTSQPSHCAERTSDESTNTTLAPAPQQAPTCPVSRRPRERPTTPRPPAHCAPSAAWNPRPLYAAAAGAPRGRARAAGGTGARAGRRSRPGGHRGEGVGRDAGHRRQGESHRAAKGRHRGFSTTNEHGLGLQFRSRHEQLVRGRIPAIADLAKSCGARASSQRGRRGRRGHIPGPCQSANAAGAAVAPGASELSPPPPGQCSLVSPPRSVRVQPRPQRERAATRPLLHRSLLSGFSLIECPPWSAGGPQPARTKYDGLSNPRRACLLYATLTDALCVKACTSCLEAGRIRSASS